MARILGSTRSDSLSGTAEADQILGFEGNDFINGRGGNDTLEGGPGNDNLTGSDGSDILLGGDGDDFIAGGFNGNFSDPDGDDVLVGGLGNNTYYGGNNDVGAVSSGNDTFYMGPGNNVGAGGDGTDTAIYNQPYRAYTVTQATAGFPGPTSRQFDNLLLVQKPGGTQDRLIELENLQFLDGRIVRDLNDPIARVVRLYKAALDRAPDPEGLNFWASNIAAGVPIRTLAGQIAGSAEFQTRYNAGDNTGFVQQLYRNALGREADAPGINFWLTALASGSTRGDVLVQFSESAENKANTAPLIQAGIYDQDEGMASVARLYDTAFNRLPDLAGLLSWKDALSNGGTVAQVAQAFSAAPEFLALYGGPGAAPGVLVDALYRNTLDRAPDQAGRDFWVRQIETGTATRAQVVLGFSESAEHRASTLGNIEGGLRYT